MFNDAVIANRVREAILLNSQVSAQDIIVTSHEGVVVLAGDVDTPQQRHLAEDTALTVPGVRRVENNLFVRPGRWPPVEPEIFPWVGRR
jgi:hyperosmotically inducible protein